jgi:hypothetical protein
LVPFEGWKKESTIGMDEDFDLFAEKGRMIVS